MDYNLKGNARINSIEVLYNAWVKNSSGSETNVPVIPGVDITLNNGPVITDNKTLPFYPAQRNVIFKGDAIKGITPSMINSKNFNVIFNPKRNPSVNPGKMYVDYIALGVDSTDPTYSLVASASNIKLGNDVTYTLTLKNTNKVDQGYPIPITLNIPNGLEYMWNNGGGGYYNNNTGEWLPILNNNGIATIQIGFRAISSGNQTIKASINGFTTSISKTITVYGANYTLSSTLLRTCTQGNTVKYNITVKSDSTLQETINVNVPIPSGFAYVSSDPSYNPISQVWAATFNNQQDTLQLILVADTSGTYVQTITTTHASISNTITIIPSNIGSCNYVEIPLPDDLKVYLLDGQEYYISCEMEIVSSLSGTVYEGYNNFSIALEIGDDEEEKEDAYEQIGTSPDTLNIFERVYAQFVYEENADMSIRIYGQYSGLQPGSYNVMFGKWSISNLSTEFEQSGVLISDPSLLCGDGDYAELDLDPGESSKPIVLSNFNFSGLEYDPTIIIKGIGIQLDYVCSDSSTLNITLMTNNQVSTQSILLNPTVNTVEIGGSDDKWDIINPDLTNIQISYTINNTSLNPISIQLKNLQFNLYNALDQTNGNMGFTINGEHSRNYDIFMSNDGAKNEGTVPTLTTYDISNSEGELITQIDLKAKKITCKFSISGDTQIDAQNKLTNATKFLSNKLNSLGLPIPNQMIFDWDPDRSFNVVLSDEIKVTLDTFTYTCEADFTISDGVGWNELKTSGAIGTNEGLIEVRPLITVLTTGGNVQNL